MNDELEYVAGYVGSDLQCGDVWNHHDFLVMNGYLLKHFLRERARLRKSKMTSYSRVPSAHLHHSMHRANAH